MAHITTKDLHKPPPPEGSKEPPRAITTAMLGDDGKPRQLPGKLPDGYEDKWTKENPDLNEVIHSGAWADAGRAFVIGGGPSVNTVDPDRLKGELVIGINRAFERFPWQAINASMDLRFWAWLNQRRWGEAAWEMWEAGNYAKVWIHVENCSYTGTPTIHSAEQKAEIPLAPESFDKALEEGFPPSIDSGYFGVMLAAALGVKTIYLLGFDMHGNEMGQQTWWHKGYPVVQDAAIYENIYIPRWKGLIPVLEERGHTVVNLNADSALADFMKVGTLSGVKRRKRPRVIGYYTSGSPYEELAKGLKLNAALFGLECSIYAMDSTGSWEGNTQLKPKVILQAMKDHPEDELLYLDVDARIEAYPDLLDNMDPKVDVMWHQADWGKYASTGRTDLEVLGGTVWLRNTKATKEFIRLWDKACRAPENKGIWEQRVLQKLVSTYEGPPLKLQELPAAYCQIYDIMAEVGAPVIAHYQASRKLKAGVNAGPGHRG